MKIRVTVSIDDSVFSIEERSVYSVKEFNAFIKNAIFTLKSFSFGLLSNSEKSIPDGPIKR